MTSGQALLTDETLKNKPSLLKHFTGQRHRAFKKLSGAFAGGCAEAVQVEEAKREGPRRRRAGGGRKSALPTLDDILVFILVYFKDYPGQVGQGYCFGLGAGQANEWMQRLTPGLNQALGYEGQLPARQSQPTAQ